MLTPLIDQIQAALWPIFVLIAVLAALIAFHLLFKTDDRQKHNAWNEIKGVAGMFFEIISSFFRRR
jgi:hypothetical protein